jgi:hypothetical protein
VTKLTLSPRSILRIIAALIVLSLSILACGLGGGAPAAAPEATEEPALVLPTQLAPEEPSEGEPPATAVPAIPEQRRLTLEYPSRIRSGDSDVVRLTLEVDDLGNITPTAQFEGNVVTGEVIEIPNLYETHNVIAEARFDISGLQVSPPELVSQTFSKGQSLNFYWSVRPTEVGNYRGTIWFYLRFVDKVNGEESRRAVSAQIVEIEAVNLLGLPVKLVRTVGGVGSVIGAVIGFPFFDDIVKFVFRRRRRKK